MFSFSWQPMRSNAAESLKNSNLLPKCLSNIIRRIFSLIPGAKGARTKVRDVTHASMASLFKKQRLLSPVTTVTRQQRCFLLENQQYALKTCHSEGDCLPPALKESCDKEGTGKGGASLVLKAVFLGSVMRGQHPSDANIREGA